MINKLKAKIFLLIMISLSILVISMITIFGILNYTNTLKSATFMMDRVSNFELKRFPNDNKMLFEKDDELKLEGVYSVEIRNSEIIEGSENSEELNSYALKIASDKSENGVVGKYLYKVMRTPQNTVRIVFMENEKTIINLKMIVIYSSISVIVAVVVIYWISKKLSETIVKPVQDTFEKQKQFISDASHELKTPLAVIEANSDVLENELGENKWLGYIQNEISSMDKLINELLLLAKTENGETVKNYTNFDLSKEAEMIISAFESMAFEKKVQINANIQENIQFNGDREDVKHIVSTLLDNAIKHSISENNVEINISKEKNEVFISVKNVGAPIPEEEKEKIFERFYRIDKARNRNEKRYGLGLAIAKATVEKYGGKIEVTCKDGTVEFKASIWNDWDGSNRFILFFKIKTKFMNVQIWIVYATRKLNII